MKILISYMKARDEQQKDNLKKIKKTIKEYFNNKKYNLLFEKREKLKECKGYDLIITIGGDGTLLRTARCVKDKAPFFGINLDLRYKEGFLLQSNIFKLKKDLEKILNKKYKIIKIDRLEASINNKKIPLIALNEFYIGNEKSYLMSRYEFIINGKKEFQKSSGIIVGTGAGSNAWLKSANGKKLNFNSNKFQMLVREPFCSKKTQCSIKNVIFNNNQIFKIKSEIHKGIIIADSIVPEIKFKKNDIIKVFMSKHKLDYIVLK